MQIENENTFKACLQHELNLFLGAGFSALAADADGTALPTGGTLKADLIREFSIRDADVLTLPQICTIIESSRKRDLRSYLDHRFAVKTFDPRYSAVLRLPIRTIFTTNIDDLLFQLFATSADRYINDLDLHGPAFRDRDAVDIVTLHGCILDQSRPLRFADTDLAAAFASDPDRWHLLTQRMEQTATLFWGYSLGDAGTLQALNPQSTRGRPLQDRWIVLRPADATSGTQQFFRALGFQLIIADTTSLLDYLANLSIPQGYCATMGNLA